MENVTTTPNEIRSAINLCIQAYSDVRSKLPPNAGDATDDENYHSACAAYLHKLPILCDPASFQHYLACIAHGASIGIIDPVDIGRFCHVAQIAMSAWKLANLTVPAAQKREEQEKERQAQKQEKQGYPLPSKGNQDGDLGNIQVEMALQNALNRLPRFEVQKQHFQLLRNRGHLLPCDSELRDNPLTALHFCRMAEKIIRDETLADLQSKPEPGLEPSSEPAPDPQGQSQQAA